MFQRRYAAALALVLISAASGWGDIYRWDTGEVILKGIFPPKLPNLSLQQKHLEYADFSGVNLTGTSFRNATLTRADFTGANLTDADLRQATLSEADLSNAVVKEASFWDTTRSGFTAEQLYSTASYQQGDLSGIRLRDNNLTGWNFAGKNLTDASFALSAVTGTDFTGANVTDASFYDVTGFTAEQLYSTASYQEGNLSGLRFGESDISGWNFAGTNLTDADFDGATLTEADFTAANLTDASFQHATVSGADFSGSDLTDAYFIRATLSEADLSNAVVKEASFRDTTRSGFTAEQLYSTASYQQGDLSGVQFGGNDLTGWNFAGKDLGRANFARAIVIGADFSGANLTGASFFEGTVRGADFTNAVVTRVSLAYSIFDRHGRSTGFTAEQLYSTANYQQGDLSGIDLAYHDFTGCNFAGKNLTGADLSAMTLTQADFTGANLTDANLGGVTLSGPDGASVERANVTGADFTDAVVKGTRFGWTRGFTAEQLYSTASYQDGDLSGIGLEENDLTGWNFAGKNLTDASFDDANFSQADFSGADLRGADMFFAVMTDNTRNMIWPSGDVYGLDLTGEGTVLTVRDYEVPVSVSDNFVMNDDSRLELILSDATWESHIGFAADVTPELGGTLALTLSPAADLAQMAGQTFDLFDWSGALEPTNVFSRIQLPDGRWDSSQLYVTGEVVLTALPGDANGDLEFNQFDIVEVLASGKYLSGQPAVWDEGDWNNDGLFNQLDIVAAQQAAIYLTGPYAGVQGDAFVAVPEPSTLLLLAVGVFALALRRYRVAVAG